MRRGPWWASYHLNVAPMSSAGEVRSRPVGTSGRALLRLFLVVARESPVLSVSRGNMLDVTEETWRPLGVDTEAKTVEYDALHDGVPNWMWDAYWRWVRETLTIHRRYSDGSGSVPMAREKLAEELCQTLRIPLSNIRVRHVELAAGKKQLSTVTKAVVEHPQPLQVADYLLAFANHANSEQLDALLTRSKSAWTIGTRAGRPALVPRVPLGVQVAADSVMARAGRAGVRLAKAWEELYRLEANPSAAYGLAIKAVEDAAVPVVSPANGRATLGTVLAQMEQQTDWQLPMEREHDRAPSRDVLIGMMRMLWHGQHDRHGGQPSVPGDVTVEEATVAVSLAVTLVNVFNAGLVARALA